jgi:hypothetical protein
MKKRTSKPRKSILKKSKKLKKFSKKRRKISRNPRKSISKKSRKYSYKKLKNNKNNDGLIPESWNPKNWNPKNWNPKNWFNNNSSISQAKTITNNNSSISQAKPITIKDYVKTGVGKISEKCKSTECDEEIKDQILKILYEITPWEGDIKDKNEIPAICKIDKYNTYCYNVIKNYKDNYHEYDEDEDIDLKYIKNMKEEPPTTQSNSNSQKKIYTSPAIPKNVDWRITKKT